MSSTHDMFRDLVPGADEVEDATIDRYIGYAVPELDPLVWGIHYEKGAVLLAGHLWSRKKAKSPGAVVSKGTGGRSEGYSQLTGNEVELLTTVAGAAFVRLRDSLMGALVI